MKKYICINNTDKVEGRDSAGGDTSHLIMGQEYEGEIKGDRMYLSNNRGVFWPERFKEITEHSYSIF